MGSTVLALVQAACYESNIPAPSALTSATDTGTLQLIHLFYATGRELRAARCWAQLKKKYTVYLTTHRSYYTLPQDFYAALPLTHWDDANTWEMRGPLTDGEWAFRRYGYVTTENRKAYRVFGPDINSSSGRGQFEVDPTPEDGDQDTRINFEYISKSWLIPPLWTASEAGVAQNTYRFSAGNIYKKTDAGAEAGGTIAPTMAFGVGQDGSVMWKFVSASAWGATTLYAAGTYVTNDGGKLYYCTGSGTSAGAGGPTGSGSADITDGTVTWLYKAAPARTGQTSYTDGDHITVSSVLYRCVQTGVSGANAPDWTATTVPDNAITYTFQEPAYETIVTDSDLCLFDDELMIAGLKWRFLRARGLKYEDLLFEYQVLKNKAAMRWNIGHKISLAKEYPDHYVNIPEGSFG